MKKIIGIDLGTTTSAVGVYSNEKIEIIPSLQKTNLIDSAVVLDNYNNIIVGREAKNDFVNGIIEIKRRMGTNYIANSRGKEFLPEEVSAEILKYVKEYAEEHLGEKIDEAVITVPANFNAFQKIATIKAAALAGLKVERVINEPTAAALAYGFDKLDNEEKILVYDFGGGTFDVSILEFDMGIMDVVSGDGDNHLGGKDIDETIMMYLGSKHGIVYKGNENREKYNILKNTVEAAKIDLSRRDIAEIIIPEFNLSTTLTREKFEELIKDVVDKTLNFIDNALKKANLNEKDIDVVLPVGGTSNIPYIQKKIEEKFGDKVYYFDNLQEAVALGAAVQGAIKSGEIPSETGIILTDICSHALGISCVGNYHGMSMPGVFSEIIQKHSSLPADGEQIYTTSSDNQTEARIQIYEGKEELVMENIGMGELLVKNIPLSKAGLEKIIVKFEYDLNGILHVIAIVESTGDITEGTFEIRKAKDKIEVGTTKSIASYKSSLYYSDYKTVMDIAEKKLETASEKNCNTIKNILNQMKEALLNDDKNKLNKLDDELTDILFEV
ncbi:Hsp70 family protein [Cetobacterium sp. 2G large]|uniref:Hsp70 family protein n=1 Tax=Cetobacterium sp. 2G large TaxID=2759680 RepID=UPI00163B8ED0|nr:Hsp70 family protein [Cetobacterium sp. 2G large]MBC2853463.1 Hsp70 family protein [Cetobacterium sp. 2G large]